MIDQYAFGNYQFDTESGLHFNGNAVHLPPKERGLLHALLNGRGQVVRKDELVTRIWPSHEASDESISRTVYRLRSAMQKAGGPDVIETVYNSGFRLRVGVRVSRIEPITGQGSTRTSQRPRAITALTAAREFLARRSPQDVDAAAHACRIAITMDPHFAAAWAMLADIRIFQAVRGLRPAREAGWLARQAAETALDADPDSAAARASRGWVAAMVEQDVARGLRDLDAAVQLDPEYWGSHVQRAWALQAAGRHSEAVAMVQRATELNAMGHGVHALLAQFQLLAGELDAAQASAQELAQRFITIDSAQAIASTVFGCCGRVDDALRYAERALALGAPPALRAPLAYALAASGQADEARRVLQEIEQAAVPQPGPCMAATYLALGDATSAVARLVDAHERGVPQFAWARDDPRLTGLREHPHLAALWAALVPPQAQAA